MDQWAGRTNEPDGKRRHNKVISLSRALFPKSIQPEHYYGSALIHDLREKTSAGKWAEEFLCARAIDEHPKVKHWVRNVEKNLDSLSNFLWQVAISILILCVN